LTNPWAAELWRLVALGTAALLLGLLTGRPFLVVLLATLAYLGWHLVNLYRLERWLREGKGFQPPNATGIWGEVYHHYYRLQQRNRQRKRRLAAYLNRFQEAAAALPDAVVLLRPGGEIEWANEAASRLLGLRGQDVGQRIANLVRHPAFTQVVRARGSAEPSPEFPSPVDSQTVLIARLVPYGNDQRLLVVRDVTRLQRLEEMRRDFVANVSHELRTPLTVVHGFIETIADAEDDCARHWARPLELVQQQTTRMQRIVEDLLLLSRLEMDARPSQVEPVDVPQMLAAIRDDALALSGEHAHCVELKAERGLWLRGAPEEVRSAFSNLVFNAVRYTPDGGTITIRWYADQTGAHMEVQDSGIGIPAPHIPRLTERFYRVDTGRSRAKGGTGLGLAIVKHVLSRHEAGLRIDSELGRGSTFACDFPPRLTVRRAAGAEAGDSEASDEPVDLSR
jgi:two-component system, OmpR family, phosphate regulon sensor histidine kinase PhoR